MLSTLAPLRQFLQSAPLPEEFFPLSELPADFLDGVYVVDFEIQQQWFDLHVRLTLAFTGELALAIPGFDLVTFVAGSDVPGFTFAHLSLRATPERGVLAMHDILLAARFDPSLLKPVALNPADPVAPFAEIQMQGTVGVDTNFDVDIQGFDAFRLTPAMIGDTGIIVRAEDVRPLLLQANPELFLGEAEVILPGDVALPGLTAVLPAITFSDARLNPQGFSGEVAVDWPLAYHEDDGEFQYRVYRRDDDGNFVLDGDGNPVEDVYTAELFGLNGGVYHIGLVFVQNQLLQSDITGFLRLPYFDEPVQVRLNVQSSGDFTITLLGVDEDGITLTKEELLSLTVQSLVVRYLHEQQQAAVIVSGGLEPLLMAGDGLEWPRLDVTDLSIEQNLADLTEPPVFKFREAWLDLKELATLDLWGFHFELNRVGLGYEETSDKLWLDLTGNVRLIELLPVGVGVEGFRITWPRLLYEEVFAELNVSSIEEIDLAGLLAIASRIEVKFDGVYLFYGVPQAVEFEGYIRFIKEAQKVGFAGDVVLRVPASGFGAEAGLMVGITFPPDAIPLPYLYVYLGVELPSGIPLGQSGLALKGALGLLGLNVLPDKTPEQNWYYDWYKREPFVGAHQTNKWDFARWAIALGAGVTITTTDGKILGVRGLLVLALPGPFIMIEGRALVFEGVLPLEPPLRALAVFDGAARTVQLNIEAEAEFVEDMLEAYAMAEAFFDFKDFTNWHLYLGQEEPADRRIRANILKLLNQWLFDANAYLMLDMINAQTLRARLGVLVAFDPPIPDSLGPVKLTFEATLAGEGLLTVFPEQFSGDVDLTATLGVSAFGFGAQVSAGADVLTTGPNPLVVEGALFVEVEIPSPTEAVESLVSLLPVDVDEALPEIEPFLFTATFPFRWESPQPPAIAPPLALVAADSAFAAGSSELALTSAETFDSQAQPAAARRQAAESAPVVPVDARPLLQFHHPMNQAEGLIFGRHPDGARRQYSAGPFRFAPELVRIDLYEHRKGDAWDGNDWTRIASTHPNGDGVELLRGVWQADSELEDASAPAVRRLRLWSENPFLYPGALDVGYNQFLLAGTAETPAQAMLTAYPAYYDDRYREPAWTCVTFDDAPRGAIDPKAVWRYQGLRFRLGPVAEVTGVAEPARRARPPFDARRLQPLLARTAGRGGPGRGALSDRSLARWARELPAAERVLLRRTHPEWRAVWEWLWPDVEEKVCLLVTAKPDQSPELHLRFPEPVQQVRLRFCRPADPNATVALTKRTRRARRETAQIEQEAAQKGIAPDYDACIFGVAHTLTTDGDTWLIEAEGAFDCLSLQRQPLLLAEVCYLTAAEAERARRAGAQADANDDVFATDAAPLPTLQPGSYYRLVVQTATDAELPDAALADVDPLTRLLYENIFANELGAAFQATGSDNPRRARATYTHESFFQTEGPPDNLAPYLQWSHPAPSAARFFRQDDLALRFRRSYLPALFAAPAHTLTARVRAMEGQLLPGYATTWTTAASETLLPEELRWREHLLALANGPALDPDDRQQDAVLLAQRTAAALAAQSRYELLVTGGGGGRLLHAATGEHGPLAAGDGAWSDIDLTVDVRLAATTDRVALRFRDAVLAHAPGEPPQRRYYRLDVGHDQATLYYVVGDGDGAETWTIATAAVSLPPGEWVRLRVVALANEVRVWQFRQQLLDVDLRAVTAAAPDGSAAPLPALLWQGTVALEAAAGGPSFRGLTVRDAALLRLPFVTSAFDSFSQLAAYDGPPLTLEVSPAAVPTPDPALAAAVATATLAYERALVDYRDSVIDRELLEAYKLALRAARDAHDAAFREAAGALSAELLYQPLPSGLELVLARRADNGATAAFWLRAPESLDLRWDGSGGNVAVGRTEARLERQTGSGWTAVTPRRLHDADSTQLILLPPAGSEPWASGAYRLTLTYHRDYGDETAAADHRYDRPVAYRDGGDGAPETVTLSWQVAP